MPKFAANVTTLFNEVPMLERFVRAAGAGFQAVEAQLIYDWPAADLAGALQRQGLSCALFNLPAGNWDAGELGIAALPGREAEFQEGIELGLAYAEALQPGRMHVMAGVPPDDCPPEAARALFLENLGWAADQAAEQGQAARDRAHKLGRLSRLCPADLGGCHRGSGHI